MWRISTSCSRAVEPWPAEARGVGTWRASFARCSPITSRRPISRTMSRSIGEAARARAWSGPGLMHLGGHAEFPAPRALDAMPAGKDLHDLVGRRAHRLGQGIILE